MEADLSVPVSLVIELALGFISVVATVVVSVATLAYWLGKKFAQVDAKFKEMDARFSGLMLSLVESNRVIVEFLGVKGLIGADEATYLTRRVEALMKVGALTALSKSELEFLRSFFARAPEGVTEEEADMAYEMARDWWLREPKAAVAFQAAIAAIHVKAYLLSKRAKRNKAP